MLGSPTYMLLYVLDEERRCSQVVNREVKEALDFFVVEVHCNEVGHPCLGHHVGNQLGGDAPSLTHLAVLTVREVRHDPNDLSGRRSLGCIACDQHLHYGIIDRGHVPLLSRMTCLNNEYIFPTHRLHDLHCGLCVHVTKYYVTGQQLPVIHSYLYQYPSQSLWCIMRHQHVCKAEK